MSLRLEPGAARTRKAAAAFKYNGEPCATVTIKSNVRAAASDPCAGSWAAG